MRRQAEASASAPLELDPVRAPVVRAICDWYLSGGVGLLQIRDRLNADPDRYPPPVPVDPATAKGHLEPVERVGGAAQPEVHRLSGVEPAGP